MTSPDNVEENSTPMVFLSLPGQLFLRLLSALAMPLILPKVNWIQLVLSLSLSSWWQLLAPWTPRQGARFWPRCSCSTLSSTLPSSALASPFSSPSILGKTRTWRWKTSIKVKRVILFRSGVHEFFVICAKIKHFKEYSVGISWICF